VINASLNQLHSAQSEHKYGFQGDEQQQEDAELMAQLEREQQEILQLDDIVDYDSNDENDNNNEIQEDPKQQHRTSGISPGNNYNIAPPYNRNNGNDKLAGTAAQAQAKASEQPLTSTLARNNSMNHENQMAAAAAAAAAAVMVSTNSSAANSSFANIGTSVPAKPPAKPITNPYKTKKRKQPTPKQQVLPARSSSAAGPHANSNQQPPPPKVLGNNVQPKPEEGMRDSASLIPCNPTRPQQHKSDCLNTAVATEDKDDDDVVVLMNV
jgi:hypothetical protein